MYMGCATKVTRYGLWLTTDNIYENGAGEDKQLFMAGIIYGGLWNLVDDVAINERHDEGTVSCYRQYKCHSFISVVVCNARFPAKSIANSDFP